VSVQRSLKRLVPSGLRELYRERELRRRHGLTDLGETTPRWISPSSRFGRNCRVNGRVQIVDSTFGDWSYIEMDARIMGARVGRFTSIGPGAHVGLPGHPVADNVSLHPAFYQHRPRFGYYLVAADVHGDLQETIVGNDVWIGAAALIRDGVTISDGAVIGAGAVVTRDVPAYAIVAGAPARPLRYRFDPDTIDFLLTLRWWDQPEDWLRAHADELRDIEVFRARHDPAMAPSSSSSSASG
jgi:acetyltransferase-like isoleucine patch superfamily enzyme